MTEQAVREQAGRRWATVARASEYGGGISRATIKRLIADGVLRAYRPRGGLLLIDLDELDEAIAATAVGAAQG